MQTSEDRAIGVLFGLAAGDRIGGPIRMALRMAESLRDIGDLEISDIGARYLDWWRGGAFDTGPTTAQVLTLVDSGIPFEEASLLVHERLGGMTAGCNPAHRIAPLAMLASLDKIALDQAAVAEARLTHRHPLAGETSAVVVHLCRALICGLPWSAALGVAAAGRSPEIRQALEIPPADELSAGGFAPEVLRSAFYFLDTSDSFSTTLARSISFSGAANYCPVLVGSIGGARWGRSQIEEGALLHRSDLLERLTAVAISLGAAWRIGQPL